jgi:hypothetical protein
MHSFSERFLFKFIHIVNFANSDDSEGSQVGTDDQRLRVIVADHTYADISTKLWEISLEFRPEIVILNAMNGSGKPTRIVDREAATFGSQV